MSSIKLKHSGGNSVIIAAPSSNPAADRTINLNDNYAGDGSFVTADSSGNVGIGTTNPSSFNADGRNLVVGTGSGGQGLSIYSANNNYGNIYFADGTSDGSYNAGGILYNHSSNFMRFDTAATERIRIDSNGHFLIGTTAARTGNKSLTLESSNAFIQLRYTGTGSLSQFSFMRNTDSSATEVGNITTTGSATTYNTSSDYRLKENVVGISDGITRLKTLKPYRFNFIIDPDKTVDGFLAHEVTPVVPEAITGTKDAVDSDNNPVYQGIDQSKLVPLLTAALQEAVAKIEVLETKVAALEAG